jgi:hypothetical protein
MSYAYTVLRIQTAFSATKVIRLSEYTISSFIDVFSLSLAKVVVALGASA